MANDSVHPLCAFDWNTHDEDVESDRAKVKSLQDWIATTNEGLINLKAIRCTERFGIHDPEAIISFNEEDIHICKLMLESYQHLAASREKSRVALQRHLA